MVLTLKPAGLIDRALLGTPLQTPAHLRSHIIHSLTQKTLDPEVPHAQQLKALELLGKITEVSLFTHRVEHIKTDTSEAMKEKLIKSLSLAMKSTGDKKIAEYSAESLLAELTGEEPVDDSKSNFNDEDDMIVDVEANEVHGEGVSKADSADPTLPHTQFFGDSDSPPLHSIPHTQTQTFKNSLPNQDPSTITSVIVREGVVKNTENEDDVSSETPPVTKGGSHE